MLEVIRHGSTVQPVFGSPCANYTTTHHTAVVDLSAATLPIAESVDAGTSHDLPQPTSTATTEYLTDVYIYRPETSVQYFADETVAVTDELAYFLYTSDLSTLEAYY